MLERLERKFGRYAIPNLTLVLIGFQVFFYVAAMATNGAIYEQMVLIWDHVFAGEVWRVLTFVLMPPPVHPVFFLIAMYVFWLMGTSLDHEWGHFRYNIYLLIGFALTALAGLINPTAPVSNIFVLISVMLAFDWLYPEFEFLLFFIIPVKAKWFGIVIAFILAALLLAALARREWQEAAVIVAGVANFFLFFGPDMVRKSRSAHRRRTYEADLAERAATPFHQCVACGRSDKSDPDREFRYCPQCSDAACYCMEHIFDHEHR